MAEGKTWEDIAKEKQQVFYEVFGDRDWDSYKESELQYFRRNIGHAIYGPPDEEPSETTNLGTGYSRDKLKHIKLVCDTIKQQDVHLAKAHDETRVSVIYVIMKLQIEDYSHVPSPLFRVPKHGNTDDTSNIFIDSNCRVYMGWATYLKKNKLPQCTYCFPRNGVYLGDVSDQVIVDFSVTPAGTLTHRVLNGVDTLGTVVSVGATLVTMAAFAVPVAGSVMLATTVSGAVVGAYGAGRSVESIVDRKIHRQPIGLKDAESRNSWISLAANSLGLAAAGASKTVSVLASRGSVVGKTGCFFVNAAQISSIAVNGIGIVNGFFVLRKKSKTGDLTCLEVFQFSSSILFFTNSVINLKTAKTIIRETQQNVIQEFEANLRSNRHRKAYQRLARNAREGLDSMNGDAKVIKSIKNINNPDDFFSGVVRVQKQFNQEEARMSFTETGHVDINNQLQVDPSKFAAIDKGQRKVILEASKQFADGTLNRNQYEATVNPIYMQHGLETTQQRLEAMTQVCPNSAAIATNLMDVDIGGSRIFANLQPSDMQRVVAVVRKTFSPDILYIAVKLAQALHFYGTADFIKFLEFSSGFIDQILSEMEYAYFEMLSGARCRSDFNQSQFDQEYGIQGDRRQHFLNAILKVYSIGQKCLHMRDAYERYKATLNQIEDPQPTNNNHENLLIQAGPSSRGISCGNLSISATDMEHMAIQHTNSDGTENQVQDSGMPASDSGDLSSIWAQLQLPGLQPSNNARTGNEVQDSRTSIGPNGNLSTAWAQLQLPTITPSSNQIAVNQTQDSTLSSATSEKMSRTWEDMDHSGSSTSLETGCRSSKHFKPSPAISSTSVAGLTGEDNHLPQLCLGFDISAYGTSGGAGGPITGAANTAGDLADRTEIAAVVMGEENHVPHLLDLSTAATTGSAAGPTDDTAVMTEENHAPQLRLDRDFSAAGLLSVEEHYSLAQMLTGVEANKYNAYVEQYDELTALVVVMDHDAPQRVVLVTCDTEGKKITANELV